MLLFIFLKYDFNFAYIIGLISFFSTLFFSFYFIKKIERNFKNRRYKNNYKILKSFDWREFYVNNSIEAIKILKVDLNTFYIPITSFNKQKDPKFDDVQFGVENLMENFKIINKFKINNSIKFKFKNQIIQISYHELFLDENTNKIYCKIEVDFFDINIDQINFNNFYEFYAKKGTYRMETDENVIKFTLYKVIDRYNDLEDFNYTENSKFELIDTVSIIPGLFAMRKMLNERVNSKMGNIVKKDCFNLINFSF
ncbi:hypothetical protein [Spiroplasma floricola]|uniref:Uncharacterized protein n=1 Tax=Spiroplasma floricola 23-6 TaxID=1336749 RepID=A0A2K8SEL5_9MOLU|nr:hypothetical protein [Spiroplasma floricola]AUB31889.1 hypothetical protein SFLOR_v1c08410 [Spiroplasma floricola 23-6]